MRTINLITVVLTLTTIVLFTCADPISRLRRQLFNPFAAPPSSSSSNSATGNGLGSGSGFSIPSWLGSVPQQASKFSLPIVNMFPNPDQVRQKANDYFASKYNNNINLILINRVLF